VLAGAGLVGLLVGGFVSLALACLAFADLFLAFAVDLVDFVVGEFWVAEDGPFVGGAACRVPILPYVR
jgi:hypothetical protein